MLDDADKRAGCLYVHMIYNNVLRSVLWVLMSVKFGAYRFGLLVSPE